MNIPPIVPQNDLKHAWFYRDHEGNPIAIVARYESSGKSKKWYLQFKLEGENWVQGLRSPLPIFGLDILHKIHSEVSVYLFEGEKYAGPIKQA
jgi:hypothetical protein